MFSARSPHNGAVNWSIPGAEIYRMKYLLLHLFRDLFVDGITEVVDSASPAPQYYWC